MTYFTSYACTSSRECKRVDNAPLFEYYINSTYPFSSKKISLRSQPPSKGLGADKLSYYVKKAIEETIMNSPSPPKARGSRQVNVEIPAELEAIYSNFVMLTHSASEMIMDFARLLPRAPKAKVHARIIMTPMNAKLLYKALEENLTKFEERFGEIKTTEQAFEEPRTMGFVPSQS